MIKIDSIKINYDIPQTQLMLHLLIHTPSRLFASFKPIIYPNKGSPQPNIQNILITAALPYVNNTPHLGNIIGGVLSADAYARYCRMRGHNVMFVCGTDEYGTTTEVKAIEEKVSPQQICDKYHRLHKEIYEWFEIDFDHFGRTSLPIHSEITNQIFKQIADNNWIQNKKSHHFYCQNCKMSLADRYVKGECSNCGSKKAKGDQCDDCSTIFKDPIQELNNPRCSVCANTPTVEESEHLYLRLANLSDKLTEWLVKGEGMKQWSNNARAVTNAWLAKKLQNRCITRDLNWGVSVPSEYFSTTAKKVFYVWFEAPLGYISITADAIGSKWRDWWTPNQSVQLTQFMGKDNIVFHSTMAPAALMATGLPFIKPHRLAVTEYLMYEGGKFSKSNNIGVFGNDCQTTGIESDVWRYYLLSNRPEAFDNQFTWENLAVRNKKQLLNVIGNMVNRVLKFAKSRLKGRIPPINPNEYSKLELSLIQELKTLVEEYCGCMDKTQIKAASIKLINMGSSINKYLQDSEFWAKSNIENKRTDLIIGLCIRIIEFYAILMRPFVPTCSTKILQMLAGQGEYETNLGFHHNQQPWKVLQFSCLNEERVREQNRRWQKITLSSPEILFRQIPENKLEELAAKYGVYRGD